MKQKATQHKEYNVEPTSFDGYNKDSPIQDALGSRRVKQRQEATDIRSVNWKPGVSGWRLTKSGLELGSVSTGLFPPGSITFTDIQNVATSRLLGRTTAGSGSIEELTAASAKTLLAIVKADISDLQTLAAGTYTPTRSAEVNMDSNVTMTEAQYMRVGATVTVSGRFTADPTAAGAASFEMTLPVASNIGAVEDVAGVAFCGAIAGLGAEIIGVVANDTAKVQWVAVDTTSQSFSYSFSFQVI